MFVPLTSSIVFVILCGYSLSNQDQARFLIQSLCFIAGCSFAAYYPFHSLVKKEKSFFIFKSIFWFLVSVAFSSIFLFLLALPLLSASDLKAFAFDLLKTVFAYSNIAHPAPLLSHAWLLSLTVQLGLAYSLYGYYVPKNWGEKRFIVGALLTAIAMFILATTSSSPSNFFSYAWVLFLGLACFHIMKNLLGNNAVFVKHGRSLKRIIAYPTEAGFLQNLMLASLITPAIRNLYLYSSYRKETDLKIDFFIGIISFVVLWIPSFLVQRSHEFIPRRNSMFIPGLAVIFTILVSCAISDGWLWRIPLFRGSQEPSFTYVKNACAKGKGICSEPEKSEIAIIGDRDVAKQIEDLLGVMVQEKQTVASYLKNYSDCLPVKDGLDRCAKNMNKVLEKFSVSKTPAAILTGNWLTVLRRDAWQNRKQGKVNYALWKLRLTLANFRDLGKQITVVGLIPALETAPANCYSRPLNLRDCQLGNMKLSELQIRLNKNLKQTVTAFGFGYIDFVEALCKGAVCKVGTKTYSFFRGNREFNGQNLKKFTYSNKPIIHKFRENLAF